MPSWYRSLFPFPMTRPIDPRLQPFDDQACVSNGGPPKPANDKHNCSTLFANIRDMLVTTSGDPCTTQQLLLRQIAETARCDGIYDNDMKVVRSRLLERMGPDAFSAAVSLKVLTPEQELKVDDALTYYRTFINGQLKRCLPTTAWVAAELVDHLRGFAAAAAVATGLYYGPRGLNALIRNARQRRVEWAAKNNMSSQ